MPIREQLPLTNFVQYQEIFNTPYDFSSEEISRHIEGLKQLDRLLPPSSTYLMVTNTAEGRYDFVSKNFEYATGLNRQLFIENGIRAYLNSIHPEEIQLWLQVVNECLQFYLENYTKEQLSRLEFQYNYRLQVGNGRFLNILEKHVNLLCSDEGRPIVGMGHFTVFGDGEALPIRASIRFLNANNEYETVFHKVYGASLLEEKISPRERDILRLVALGDDNKTIADKLFISSNTVRTHRQNLLNKIEAKNSTDLVVQCIRNGII